MAKKETMEALLGTNVLSLANDIMIWFLVSFVLVSRKVSFSGLPQVLILLSGIMKVRQYGCQ